MWDEITKPFRNLNDDLVDAFQKQEHCSERVMQFL